MADSKDLYQLLGVSRTASADEIRKAYRKLALKHHPDVSDAPDAAARFAEIQEGYDILMDDEKRKAYDQFGMAGVRGAAGGASGGYGPGDAFRGKGPGGVRFRWSTSGGGGPGGAGAAQDFDIPDLGSIFEEMFGGRGVGSPFGAGGAAGAPGAGARTRARAPQRGRDVYHPITVPFMTAATGGTQTVRITRPTGESESLEVRIPAGIDDGAKLRIRGRGNPGANGGEAGDVILTVRVGKHSSFKREGKDVLLDVPVSIAEAALGTSVTIPLLSGSAEVKIPPGTSSGSRLRIREKGIQPAKSSAGDFYAVVQIVPPKELSDDEKSLIEELATKLKNPRESAPWADVKSE